LGRGNFAAITALSENKVKYFEDWLVEKYRRRTANNPGRPHHQNASSITKEKAE
jgi:hypothetical protein